MAINNITFEIDEDLRQVYSEAKKVLFVLLGDGDFCFNYEDTLADLKKAVSKLEPIDKYGLPIIPKCRPPREDHTKSFTHDRPMPTTEPPTKRVKSGT